LKDCFLFDVHFRQETSGAVSLRFTHEYGSGLPCFSKGERMIFCLHFDGEETCIEVPDLIRKRWPGGDPGDPDLEWIRNPKISQETVRDMSIIATIDTLARELSADRQKAVIGLVEKFAANVELPRGATFSRG
jgi:hypothetical protein